MSPDHRGETPIARGLTPAESAVARRLQESIPLTERPFHKIAEEIDKPLRSSEEFKKVSMEYF